MSGAARKPDKPKRRQAPVASSADPIIQYLRDIRQMADDALNFVPGHVAKPEFRERTEEGLRTCREILAALDLTGEEADRHLERIS
jgi:hypothetical protein